MTSVTVDVDTLWEILLKLKLPDIVDTCASSEAINNFCKNENFWKDKVQLDYPGYIKPPNHTWYDICTYLAKHKRKNISIVHTLLEAKEVEKINIDPYTTFDRLLNYVNIKYNIFSINTVDKDVYAVETTGLKIKLESVAHGTSTEVIRNDFLYRIILPNGQNLYSVIETIDIM